MDPSRFQALLDMPAPSHADHLQQFLCTANWMRSAIPDFTSLIAPLSSALGQVYKRCGKRTKRAAQKIKLKSPFWTEKEIDQFHDVKSNIQNSVTLSHPSGAKIVCLFCDASEERSEWIVTQIPSEDDAVEFREQRHKALAFLSGAFKDASA